MYSTISEYVAGIISIRILLRAFVRQLQLSQGSVYHSTCIEYYLHVYVDTPDVTFFSYTV